MFLNRFGASLLILCAAAAASAQTSTPPPVKMGLWQSTVTARTTGLQLPPSVVAQLKAMGKSIPGAAPHTNVTQSCLTPEQWQKDMAAMDQRNKGGNCVTHHQVEGKKYSYDTTCKGDNGNVTGHGHFEMTVTDDQHSHGSGYMESSRAGSNHQPMKIEIKMESHYLSANCGDVKPGSPKTIKQ